MRNLLFIDNFYQKKKIKNQVIEKNISNELMTLSQFLTYF